MSNFLKSIKNILVVIGALLLLFLVFKLTRDYYKKEADKAKRAERIAIIEKDSLRKVSEGYYKRLVADTLEDRDIQKRVEELELDLKNPKIIEKIKIVPKTDTVFVAAEKSTFTDTTYSLIDYYPNEDNYFVKYESDIDFVAKKDLGRFSFQPIEIITGVEEKDGLYEATIKLPDYFDVEDYTVESTPLTPEEKDNFDWILGAGYFNNVNTGEQGIDVSGGIKFKDFYLLGSGRSDSSVGLKLLIGL